MIGSIRWISLLMACFVTVAATAPARAAGYPERPVRLIVGFAPGGGTDTLARIIATALSKTWGQPVVVENHPGAATTIAASLVARARPDGYTLLMGNNAHSIPPGFEITFDPIKDFAPIILVASQQDFFVVNPSVPANSLKELIALAKANPGTLNYSSGGQGSPPYMEMELFLRQTGIKMEHVGYQGMGPALLALVRGDVQCGFITISTSLEQVKAGKLRALAVSSRKRSPLMPSVPTVAEAADMPNWDTTSWYGILAPAGAPREIVGTVHDAVVAAMGSPEAQKAIGASGYDLVNNTPEEFAQQIAREVSEWTALVKELDSRNKK